MTRNGSGTYSLPAGNPVNTGTPISSAHANNTLSDIATALTNSLARNGETVPTANLQMGGFAHTGAAAAVARNSYATAAQVQDGSLLVIGSIAGTNTITGSLTPEITAYVIGATYVFVPAATNVGAVTIAINGLAAKSILFANGISLTDGNLSAGNPAVITYSGTSFYLQNPQGNFVVSDGSNYAHLNGTDGSLELTRPAGQPFIDLKTSQGEDFDVRIRTAGGLGQALDILGDGNLRLTNLLLGSVYVSFTYGDGSPEGVVFAYQGSLYLRRNGGAGTSLYVKEGGGPSATSFGWVGK